MVSRSGILLTMLLLAMGAPAELTGQRAASASPAACSARRSRCTPEERLLERLQRDGLPAAMAALDSISSVDPEVQRLGHNFAHALGLAAFTTPEEVAEVFALCTPAFQSGCHHGVIQSYFEDHARLNGSDLDPVVVEGLCADQRQDASQQWMLFQCTHGLGHGLMMVVTNHLPTALEGCDLLSAPWEREVCYGAVFMENIVHVTTPHHAFGRPEAAEGATPSMEEHPDDDHANHHGPVVAGPVRPPFPALDASQPLYPCTVLADRYLTSCYQMQTSAILHFNQRDIAATGRACLGAPEVLRATCMQSLGRDISALTVQDHGRALKMCGEVPEGFEQHCHLGYAKNLVDQTSDPNDGLAFCRLLTSAESKRVCYIGIGEQLWVLYTDTARRAQVCDAVEAAYVGACLLGAGVASNPDEIRPVARSEPDPA